MPGTYLPVGLRLDGRECLVVGGGAVAFRKVKALIERGAKITVIAPEVNAGIQQFVEDEAVTLISREYKSPEVEKYGLVISATDDEAVNQTVYEDCTKARVPVNVVDDPPRCDFIFPAVIHRGALTVAISTDGHAPFLTKHIRTFLEVVFGPQWQAVTDLAEAFRAEVYRRFPKDSKKHQECFAKFLEIDWPGLFVSEKANEVEDAYGKLLEEL